MLNETTNEDGVRGKVSRRNFFMRIGVAGAAAATTGPVPAAAQTPAMATEVSVDDRFRIQDVLRSYVWANDSGSAINNQPLELAIIAELTTAAASRHCSGRCASP